VKDLEKTMEILSDGAVYSRRDTLSHGYISLGDGVRVGVSGFARYNGGSLVGISEVTSLVFRIPTGSFDAREELLNVFSRCKRGALIYAPPGRGKTSALRALAHDLGERGEEVCVIDERCEFIESDLTFASVDLLRGYKRAEGIEIALRTLAPSVIALDEVGRLGEAEAMIEALSSGVKVAVTAHASSVEEVLRRPALRPFFDLGIIDVLVGIEIEDGKRVLSVAEAV
jgi:stage III sporulation protein AA